MELHPAACHSSGLRAIRAPFLKTAAAAALVNFGRLRRDLNADRLDADRRVPPTWALADAHYNDSFVFQGADARGTLFMSRIGFRGDGRRAEVWLLLDVDGRKLVNADTEIEIDAAGSEIAAGGLTYRYLRGSDTWSIAYQGALGSAGDAQPDVPCELALTYTPASRLYLSSAMMDPWATGRAMAEMPWSRAYFRALRSENQVRVEQGARLEGTLTLGDQTRPLSLLGFRDHSWGRRNWTFLRRYIWNILALGHPLWLRGKAYQFLCYTTVDYGTSFKHLVSGWFAGPEHLCPIVAASDMAELGPDGVIPNRYDLWFQPKGLPVLKAEVNRSGTPQGWLMQGGGFEVNEAYCRFTLSGQPGWGMSEFGYTRPWIP